MGISWPKKILRYFPGFCVAFGANLNLRGIPLMLKGFRSGGIFPFIKFKKFIHSIVDSVLDESTRDVLSELT